MERQERKHQNLFLTSVGSFIKLTAYTTIGSPLEVVRMRLQNSAEMVKQGYLQCNYKGIFDSVKKIAKDEGAIGFWKGGVSGSLILSICYPLENARTKLTNDKQILNTKVKQYQSISDVCKKILQMEGIRGFYRGFGISCIGIFIYRGLFFGLSDICSSNNNQGSYQQVLNNNQKIQFLVGWVVKFSSQLITYPFYTISSRMIMTTGQQQKYQNSIDCLQKIIRYEGINSLFKGVSINVIKSTGGAFTFVAYTNYLERQKARQNHLYQNQINQQQ